MHEVHTLLEVASTSLLCRKLYILRCPCSYLYVCIVNTLYYLPDLLSYSHSSPAQSLNVTISIEYSPPAGVNSVPPNYRAATSVSLRCDAVGATGPINYRWSSTCGSGCFVSGNTTQIVNRDRLGSYDAGTHRCVAFDNAGNTGWAAIEMDIIGTFKHSE